jgi:hypothetical protein
VLVLFLSTILTTILMAYVAISYHHSERGIFVSVPENAGGGGDGDGVVVRSIIAKTISTPTGQTGATSPFSAAIGAVKAGSVGTTSHAPHGAAQELKPSLPEPRESLLAVVKGLFDLGLSNPDELVRRLREEDPLRVTAGPQAFVCPSDAAQRLFDRSMVNESRLQAFREGQPGMYIFYQHLRKAGGTGFCKLASDNLGRRRCPPYFCMIDSKGSLATPPWSDPVYLEEQMAARGYGVTANEWDVLYSSMFEGLQHAVFATTIRDPIDRIYSQYRFEHLENRDGRKNTSHYMTAREYYKSIRGWTMGANYYIKTFCGYPDKTKPHPSGQDFYWTYHKYHAKPIPWTMFLDALNNIMRFHAIFVTEWLDNSSAEVLSKSFNWTVPPKKVLPLEDQHKRDANKTSFLAKDVLPPEEYQYFSIDNALDILFFQCVQVVYMERLKCI